MNWMGPYTVHLSLDTMTTIDIVKLVKARF